jgi:hypothetical protein
MARSRILNPAFFTNEDLARLPAAARLLFAGLWTIADRAGRLEDRPARIRAQLFAFEPDVDVDALLTQLANAHFIRRYGDIVGRYICVPKFLDHQKIHPREAASKLPEPPKLRGKTKSREKVRLGYAKVRLRPAIDTPRFPVSTSTSTSYEDQTPPLPPPGGTAENYEETKRARAQAMARERQRRQGK